jgi:2',3'-cyclic-nucleotide 2'-phosphodiesterase / 3'-nucleotidase / 5'-nucleotidase
MRRLLLAAALALPFALPAQAEITLEPIGRFASGVFNRSAAEIAAFDAGSRRLFVVNGAGPQLDILDLSDPANPRRIAEISLREHGSDVNSVAVHRGTVAVAVNGTTKVEPGRVVFLDVEGRVLSRVEVGILPDSLAFSPDGRWLVTANEGEPNEDYSIDPEGSISVIDMAPGAAAITPAQVRTVGFARFDTEGLPPGMHIARRGVAPSRDIEPEYVAITSDSRTAYITLQENNGIAVVDLATASITRLIGMGYQDHRQVALDPSDRDGGIRIATWPVFGMRQPDAIAVFEQDGATFLLTANEGDGREYRGFTDEARISELRLDPAAFPNAAELQRNEALGRLRVTNQLGEGPNGFNALYAQGGRSFSVIEAATGRVVHDSGEEIERVLAERLPAHFNANHQDGPGAPDARSAAKGPEPEGLAIGVVEGVPYLFVGLERVGGIMGWNIADARAPRFVTYRNDRVFGGDPRNGTAGDLGPEGVLFLAAAESPNGRPLLVVTNEVSGSVTIYEIRRR